MTVSDFITDSVQRLLSKCNNKNFRRGGSYIESPDWIKNKKAKLNLKNKDDKCFQYVAAVALNYGEIRWNPERVSNIKTFINKYNWKGMKYLLQIDDQKKVAKNNQTISLNVLYIKEIKICSAYISNINSDCVPQKLAICGQGHTHHPGRGPSTINFRPN